MYGDTLITYAYILAKTFPNFSKNKNKQATERREAARREFNFFLPFQSEACFPQIYAKLESLWNLDYLATTER